MPDDAQETVPQMYYVILNPTPIKIQQVSTPHGAQDMLPKYVK